MRRGGVNAFFATVCRSNDGRFVPPSTQKSNLGIQRNPGRPVWMLTELAKPSKYVRLSLDSEMFLDDV